MNRLIERIKNMNPQLRLFLAGIICMGIATGIFETSFNNFLNDQFAIKADVRGYLEFPRELPGFLTALFVGMLFFLPETMVAGVAALMTGLGMIGISIWGESWLVMLVFMILWSTGTHLIMPIRSAISMDLAQSMQKGRRLGQIRGIGIGAAVIGCCIVWGVLDMMEKNYSLLFAIGGGIAIIGGMVFMSMNMPGAHARRPKFIFNKKYWLYYVLAALFGARKQVFITFAPWVLVRIFHQPAQIIAQLWIVASLLGIFFQPMLGRAIDRFGERAVLMTDSVMVFIVCFGYGFSYLISDPRLALWTLYACFVGDQLLFGVNMARDTFMSKIAKKPEHIAPSLSMAVTINHAVSMTVPAIGGLMWIKWGHSSVFMGAAGVAVVMLFFSSLIRLPEAETGKV